MSMGEPGNTSLGGASTPICVEPTPICVDNVLEKKRRRWYRRNMATKKDMADLRAIRPEHIKAARQLTGKSVSAFARSVNSYQQALSRVESGKGKGGTAEGGWKLHFVRALAPQLWQIAENKNLTELKKELRALGLSPKDDDVMTLPGGSRDPAGEDQYTFDMWEPWVSRGDASMSFGLRATAKILPPSYQHSNLSYAFRMRMANMLPRFKPGDTLFVDPGIRPAVGSDCIFFNQERTRGHVAQLVGQTDTSWHVMDYTSVGGAFMPSETALDMSEWPICEKITGVRLGE